MILTTTPNIEGYTIRQYLGVVTGNAIIGADLFSQFTGIFGGRSGDYEQYLTHAKITAMSEMEKRAQEMGANAIVGVDIDYEAVGRNGSMLMVACSGTAVVI